MSYNPLVQVMFGLQNTPQARMSDAADAPSTATDDNGAETPPQLQGTAKFDMLLALRESGGVLRGVVEYNTDLFSTQRVQRLIGHYEQLLTPL